MELCAACILPNLCANLGKDFHSEGDFCGICRGRTGSRLYVGVVLHLFWAIFLASNLSVCLFGGFDKNSGGNRDGKIFPRRKVPLIF